MSNVDWRCVAAMTTNMFQALVKPESVRLVFGESVQGGQLTFQSAVIMPRAVAELLVSELAGALAKKSGTAKASGGSTKIGFM